MIPHQRSTEQDIEGFKKDFSSEISQLLQPSCREGTRVLKYLERLGIQLNIRNFNIQEVVVEITVRGLDSINRKGERIHNVAAWARSVGTIVIKDKVKFEIRDRKLKAKHLYQAGTSDTWFRLIHSEERETARKAMQQLSPADQKILRLRFLRDMSYKDIQTHYFESSGTLVQEATLRKRESRAVQRLKKKFRELYK